MPPVSPRQLARVSLAGPVKTGIFVGGQVWTWGVGGFKKPGGFCGKTFRHLATHHDTWAVVVGWLSDELGETGGGSPPWILDGFLMWVLVWETD